MNEDRRKKDDNGNWDEYRIFITQELKRQGEVQLIMAKSVQEIKDRLIAQETKIRNVSGIISFVISSIVSLIVGVILLFIKKG